jgi:SAM-dependent methyltransferase
MSSSQKNDRLSASGSNHRGSSKSVFDEFFREYDRWFDHHPFAYQSELDALRYMGPLIGAGIEIGVGTGRFAQPLDIPEGVEPSEAMAAAAERRGIRVHRAAAEQLPFPDGMYDFALMINLICFVHRPQDVFREARRILKPAGRLIVAFIDRETALGRSYLARRDDSSFYSNASFYSAREVAVYLEDSGFISLQCCQTLFTNPAAMTRPDPVRAGSGEGGFVVMSAHKPTE